MNKKVLIFSEESNEITTEYVMDWIRNLGGDVLRLNGAAFMRNDIDITIRLKKDGYAINWGEIDWDEISVVWFRRWYRVNSFLRDEIESLGLSVNESANYKNHLLQEIGIARRSFFSHLKSKYWLPDIDAAQINKIKVLQTASQLGLNVPETLVCNSKPLLVKFFEKHLDVITKPLYEVPYVMTKKRLYRALTHKLSRTDVEQLPDRFPPSLFQKNIPKQVELRIFYINSGFYPMAIFSQRDAQTSIDFRNYNEKKPNRNVPFKLCSQIEKKLDLLFKGLGLDTGSIDMILTPDNEYYFLEINPVGQFGMTSIPCNYYLEKVVAQHLLNNSK
jgi:ATP-GRASP peptide maturase of grasp-with-spasm system